MNPALHPEYKITYAILKKEKKTCKYMIFLTNIFEKF